MTFSFGAPNATAPSATQGTGFSFGGASTGAAAPTLGGFGAPTATVAPTGFGGAAAAPAATGGFGGFGAATSKPAATGFGGFGATTTTTPAATGFGGFGATATSSAAPVASGFGGFGATTTTSAAPAATGFGGFGAATATSSAAPGLGGFGTAGAAPAASGFGGFGATTASSSAAGGFGGFGAATATSSAAPVLGGFGGLSAAAPAAQLSTATTTTASLGLGGNTVAPSFSFGVSSAGGTSTSVASNQAAGQGGPAQDAKGETKNVKDHMIPLELDKTVEQLKKHIKDEKAVCSDVSHCTDKAFAKVKQETEALSQLVTVLSIGIQKNRTALEKLKLSSAQELLNVEIAQRTKDIPASMQYENTAPMDYFMRLVTQFEADMTEYRKQIDQTQHQLQLLGNGNSVSSEDISQAMRRLLCAFTELAARYQVIHEALSKCKEEYVSMYRRVHGVSVPGFVDKPCVRPVAAPMPSLSKLAGPSPFSAPSDPLIQARQIVPAKGQQPQGMSGSMMGPPTSSLNMSGTPAGAFGSLGAGGGLGVANNTSFGGTNNSIFGGGGAANTSGFGGFGANNTANKTGFGLGNTSGFGGNTSAFGGSNTTAFGGSTTAFGGNTSGFGGNTTFGSPGFSSTGVFGSTTFGSPTAGTKRNKI